MSRFISKSLRQSVSSDTGSTVLILDFFPPNPKDLVITDDKELFTNTQFETRKTYGKWILSTMRTECVLLYSLVSVFIKRVC